MNYKSSACVTLLFLVLSIHAMALSASQNLADKPAHNDEKAKPDKEKDGSPIAGTKEPQTGTSQSNITIHIDVILDPTRSIPAGAKADLDVEDQNCSETHQSGKPIQNGRVTFADVPKCKIRILFYVSGGNTGMARMNLKESQGDATTIRLKLKPDGTTEIVP